MVTGAPWRIPAVMPDDDELDVVGREKPQDLSEPGAGH